MSDTTPRGATVVPRCSDAGDIHAWVSSLPWVVEEPRSLAPDVRMFAVDCEPLHVRRVWLMTGPAAAPADSYNVSVVLPEDVGTIVARAGWAWRVAPMPPDHVLMRADVLGGANATEALILAAYECALSE
jgi:hypothetical protein